MLRRLFYFCLVVTLFIAAGVAQQPTTLPDGVKIPVRLLQDLELIHLNVGDEVRLVVTASLRGPSGEVVIPRDAVAVARVVERQLATKNEVAKLYMIIEKVRWKGGSLALHAFPSAPLRPTPLLKIDPKHADPMFRPDSMKVGFKAHSREGSYLYCKWNFVLEEGSSFLIEQTSKPGADVPPIIP